MKVGRGALFSKSEVQGIGRWKADKKEEERKELPQIMASLLL